MKRIFAVLVCILLICSVAVADTMTYVGLKVYDPVYIALDMGFFEQYGLEVELVDVVAGGATAVQMVASGSADGALLSTMALINAKSAGLPVIGVADIQSSFIDAPLEVFFVRSDSGITSVQDLRGKTIAINLVKSSFHYTWLMALEQAGMTEDDVTFVTIPFSEQLMALENGTVDAIGLMSPYIQSAVNSGFTTELYNACDVFGERQFCEIFVNQTWAEANVATVHSFVMGLRDAENWAMEHQTEAKAIVGKYTGIDPSMIADYHFQPNAVVVEDDCQYWIDYMVSHEGVNALEVRDIVTNKYAED